MTTNRTLSDNLAIQALHEEPDHFTRRANTNSRRVCRSYTTPKLNVENVSDAHAKPSSDLHNPLRQNGWRIGTARTEPNHDLNPNAGKHSGAGTKLMQDGFDYISLTYHTVLYPYHYILLLKPREDCANKTNIIRKVSNAIKFQPGWRIDISFFIIQQSIYSSAFWNRPRRYGHRRQQSAFEPS